jgi:hypothetical protein
MSACDIQHLVVSEEVPLENQGGAELDLPSSLSCWFRITNRWVAWILQAPPRSATIEHDLAEIELLVAQKRYAYTKTLEKEIQDEVIKASKPPWQSEQ